MKTTVKHPAIGTTLTDQPAIYVGTYAKYNDGNLNGAWVDMTKIADREDFNDLIKAIHADEEDPEYMFQDWQSIPDKFIGESWLSDEWFEYCEATDDMDDNEREAYAAYCKAASDTDVERFREAYAGQFDSDEDFAENMADQLGLIDESAAWPNNCIDWERAARELMYDYFEQDGHYFRSM